MTRGPLARPLPTARAILWRPDTAPPLPPAARAAGAPIFVEQNALVALDDHFTASSTQGLLGFLVGDLCRDPGSGVHYVVVDSTIRLNQAVFGDKTGVVMGKLWDRIQTELAKIEGHLIGWYHSHPPLGVGLSPGDVETHLMYFTRPWQLALVLAAEARGATAGFFRPGSEPGSVTTALAFYELLPEAEAAARPSVLPWLNYRTDADVAKAATPREAPTAADSGSTLEIVGAHGAKPAAPKPPKLRLPKYTPKPPSKPSPGPPRDKEPAGLDPRDLDQLLRTTAPAPKRPGPPSPKRPSGAVRPEPPTAPAPPPALEIERASELPPAEPPPLPPPPPRHPPRATPPPAIADLPLLHVEEPTEAAPPRGTDPEPFELDEMPPPRSGRAARPSPRASALPRAASEELARPAAMPAPRRYWRIVVIGALVVGALGAGAWFAGLLRPPPEPAPAPRRAAPPPVTRAAVDPRLVALDRLGDTLARTVRTYADRARLFDNRQMTCADLARGLVAVEQRWMSYNADGRAQAPPLDADRTRRDEGLYAAVDSVDRHFERSGCARP